MHGGHRGDAARLRDATDVRAGEAVPAGAERGAGDQHVGLKPRELARDGVERGVLLLAHEVVAADDRRHDLRRVAERLLERTPWPHRALAHGHADVSLLLAADPGEELIDEVDDAERCAHE